ncbi:NUMOD4 motif-containing HNH endonuclease [Williamsia muralis]|uniref:NUMOD4 motif-containing HNH endonuclease n=1 Tax=Williamsia marianensis TaxID=85044 RepID=UPI003F145DAF
MPSEEWRPIAGYEGQYEVSSHGRVRSMRRLVAARGGSQRVQHERILRPALLSTGHLMVRLSSHGVGKSRSVHRLVLLAFAGPPPEGCVCLHRDGVHTNNRIENLHWGTSSENTVDQVRHGVHQAARKTHCKHGHEFTPANTYTYPKAGGSTRKGRCCKTCIADRARQYRLNRTKEATNV